MGTKNGVLVTGITGKQGGAVAESLLRHGTRVVGLTRHADKAKGWLERGVELAEGDLSDRKSLDRALETVEEAFLVTTPFEGGMDAEIAMGTAFVDAAKRAGIRHLVFSSVVAADRGTGIPHFETKARIEEHLKASGVPFTIFRPVFFMENFLSPWVLPGIREGKVVMGVLPDQPIQMVALRDLGAFVLTALLVPDAYLGQTIEIAGDELTIPHALGVISRVTNHDVRYEALPDERLDQAVGEDMAKMYRWFNQGGHRVDIPVLRNKWGIPLSTFREFASRTPWHLWEIKAA